jgi:hypothetical protein
VGKEMRQSLLLPIVALLLIFGAMSFFVLMPKERRTVVSRQVVAAKRTVVPTPQAVPQLKRAPLVHPPAVTSTGFINFGSSWTADPMPVDRGLTVYQRKVPSGGDWLGMLQSGSSDANLAELSVPSLDQPAAVLAEIDSAKEDIANAEAGTSSVENNGESNAEPASATVIKQSPQLQVQSAESVSAEPAKADLATSAAQPITRACSNTAPPIFICSRGGFQFVPAAKVRLEVLSADRLARRCGVQ